MDEINREQQKSDEALRQLEQSQGQVGDLQSKLAMLSTEIERFQYKLKGKNDENEEQLKKIKDLEEQLLQMQQLPNDLERLSNLLKEE